MQFAWEVNAILFQFRKRGYSQFVTTWTSGGIFLKKLKNKQNRYCELLLGGLEITGSGLFKSIRHLIFASELFLSSLPVLIGQMGQLLKS